MATEIRVPKLGMTQTDITIVELCKSDGTSVEEGELIAVVETAKSSFEVPSIGSGLIFYELKVKDKVNIGDLLAVVAESKDEYDEYKNSMPRDKEGETASDTEQTPEEQLPSSIDTIDRKIKKRIPFVGIRKNIADNLISSLQSGAQLTIVSETDMTELSQFRKNIVQQNPENRITFVDILVKILAVALKDFPVLNSSLTGDEILCWDEYNIGVAMAIDEGLVVPVVRDAGKKSLEEISLELKELARKARNNQLEPQHYQGGTFTLSSGGKVETDFVTPIINPPESAILAIGKIAPRPMVYEDKLAIRTTGYLCLTHDHGIIDGIPASLFLGRVKEIIESPDIFEKVLS